jgi:hypothetical protein
MTSGPVLSGAATEDLVGGPVELHLATSADANVERLERRLQFRDVPVGGVPDPDPVAGQLVAVEERESVGKTILTPHPASAAAIVWITDHRPQALCDGMVASEGSKEARQTG